MMTAEQITAVAAFGVGITAALVKVVKRGRVEREDDAESGSSGQATINALERVITMQAIQIDVKDKRLIEQGAALEKCNANAIRGEAALQMCETARMAAEEGSATLLAIIAKRDFDEGRR